MGSQRHESGSEVTTGTSGADLLSAVEAQLVPAVEALGVSVVDHETSASFGNATVTLQSGELRLRVVRERSQVFVDFGSAAKPHSWFDSAVVADHLGLGPNGGFHSSDTTSVLRGLADFLRAFWGDLALRFSRERFSSTERDLLALRDARASARLGF